MRAAAALLLALAAALAGAQPSVNWLSYEDALARAAREGKVVYVYFYSRSCPYCALMEDVFRDSNVSRLLNSRFEPARVDVDQRPDLASAYWVVGTPFHVFLCPNGTLFGVAAGYRDPESFVKLLNTALAKAGERCASQVSGREPQPAGSPPGSAHATESGVVSLAAAFAFGLAAPLTPCILPLIPVVYLAASRGGRRGLGLFALGLFAAYAALGFAASGLLLAARGLAEPAAYALLLFSGLALAVDRVGRALSYLASFIATRIPQRRTANAFLLGLASSALWGPCAAPLAAAAVAVSVITPQLAAVSSVAFAGGLALAVYILGRAVRKARALASRARALKAMNRVLGALMVAAALAHFAGLV